MFRRLAVSVAVAGLATAQGISLSQQCQTALLTIAGSPDAACLNVGGLSGLLTLPQNQSVVPSFTLWLEGVCAQNPCSNDALSAIVTNVTAGCASDLSSIGLTNGTASVILSTIEEVYPTIREIGCLKETSNNTLCLTSLLDEIQNVTGTLSINSLLGEVSGIAGLNTSSGLPSYIECSDCTKQAYNILKNEQSALVPQDTMSALQSQCGASFVDGTTPSGIVEGTGTAAPTGTGASTVVTTKSGASIVLPSTALGLTGSLLLTVLSLFVVLA